MSPGIFKMSMAQYLALPYASAGLLHSVLQYSPAHARYWQTHPDEASEASDTGTAIHDALLEGMDRIQPIDALDWRTKAAKEARESARAAGLIPMLQHKVANVSAAVSAAQGCIAGSSLAGIFERGKPELTLTWNEDGLPCKSRPDWLADDLDTLLHVKTTKGSAGPDAFSRVVDSMGYAISVAWYERGLAAVHQGECHHVILAIEQEPPHGCALYDLDPAKLAIAHAQTARALATWQRCVARGSYPGYGAAIHSIEPKPWDLAQEETAQIGGAFDALAAGEM